MLILPFKERIVLLYSLACVNMSKILGCTFCVLRRCLRRVDSVVESKDLNLYVSLNSNSYIYIIQSAVSTRRKTNQGSI